MRYRAVSLLEAVLAIFLLLIGLLVLSNLFHSSLGYLPRIENQQLAALVAEEHLERMREWSETTSGSVYNYDNPGLALTYNGQSGPAPDHPHMTVSTNVTNLELYSPCSSFEMGFTPALPWNPRRSLTSWASLVQVGVSWDNGNRQLKVNSIVARPALSFRSGLNKIVVSVAGATTLHEGESSNFTAVGYDSNNNPIPGLFFQWDISSVNATGKLQQSRDGSVANLTNRIFVPPNTAAQIPPYSGNPSFSDGELYVRATARYHGEEFSANSTLIRMVP